MLLDRNGKECIEFEYGEQVTLRMAIQANIDMHILGHGYVLRDSHGNNIIYSDSLIENCSITQVKAGNKYIADHSCSQNHT